MLFQYCTVFFKINFLFRKYGEALINDKLACRMLSLKSLTATDVTNDRRRKEMMRQKLKTKGVYFVLFLD